jgi:hypothetical protein
MTKRMAKGVLIVQSVVQNVSGRSKMLSSGENLDYLLYVTTVCDKFTLEIL